jgi:hypothetical protein
MLVLWLQPCQQEAGSMKVPSACWLDPRVAVRPSPIDGLGLFAAAPINHGEIVEVLGGTILTDAEVQARTDRGERYDGIVLGPNQHLAIDSSWPGSYGNHSCDPNLWMLDGVTIGTRRRVAAGEELTVDYAVFTATSGWSMPCRCGSRLCRGVVTGGDWRRSDLQARYRGHFAPFIAELIRQQSGRPGDSGLG